MMRMIEGRSHLPFGRSIWMGLIALVLMGGWLFAQPAGPGSTNDATAAAPIVAPAGGLDTSKLPTVTEFFMFSPVINSIITALSVVAVVMFVYFLLTINIRTFAPPGFIDDVTRLALAKQFDQAAQLCRTHRTIFTASILQRCFENANRDAAHLLNIIESEGERRAGLIWNRISYLIDLSVVAPMLGLLGTVLGMLQAFFVLPHESASVSSKALAFAIGGAMTATFFGLVVAIMAVVFHAIIKSRAIRALSEAEQLVLSITDHIKRGQA